MSSQAVLLSAHALLWRLVPPGAGLDQPMAHLITPHVASHVALLGLDCMMTRSAEFFGGTSGRCVANSSFGSGDRNSTDQKPDLPQDWKHKEEDENL